MKEYNFKNKEINSLLKENNEYFEKNTMILQNNIISNIDIRNQPIKKVGKFILTGYWNSIISINDRISKKNQIDFTYNTLENLPIVFSLFFENSKLNDPPEAIKEILIKTIASYWYGLGMNEHNCELKIREGNGKNPPYWGDDISIKIGTIKEENFLLAATKTLNSPFDLENKIFLDMTPIIEAYKSAFGIDLNDYGIANMFI